ncbi:MAG: hypothetical protein O9328_13925 [Rhodobacteraceae bacterium]|nr:hypothetical protein [Paracoccaceae bacterium]
MAAARKKRAHRVVAKALLKAVADLHPEEALEALDPFYMRERDGIRRRALRAARITLMRKAVETPPRLIVPIVEAIPEPEPEPEPVVVTEPPAPKPIPKGKLLSVSLEDAAKLLMTAPEPVAEAAPAPETPAAEDVPEFAPIDWAAEAAGLSAFDMPDEPEVVAADLPIMMVAPAPAPILEMMDAAEAAAVEDSALPSETAAPAPPKRAKKVAKPPLPDLSAQFAAMSSDGMEALADVASAKPVPGLDEGLRALEALDEVAPVAAPALMVDPMAAFAAMAEEEPAPTSAGTKAQMVDPGAAFAALEAAEDEAAQAVGKGTGKPKPLAFDLSAQFAAMADEDDEQKKAV